MIGEGRPCLSPARLADITTQSANFLPTETKPPTRSFAETSFRSASFLFPRLATVGAPPS